LAAANRDRHFTAGAWQQPRADRLAFQRYIASFRRKLPGLIDQLPTGPTTGHRQQPGRLSPGGSNSTLVWHHLYFHTRQWFSSRPCPGDRLYQRHPQRLEIHSRSDSHANCHADGNGHGDSDRYSHSHSHVYTDAYSDSDSYGYVHANTDGDSKCNSDTYGYSHNDSYTYSDANSDSSIANPDGYGDSHGYIHAYPNSYVYSDSDSYCNGNGDTNTNLNAEAYTNPETRADA
jgi:hypothetical protein